jgi:type VI secretion system protein ImpK
MMPAVKSGGSRRENLALAFQEILTAIVRLRANRQSAADAASFRSHMREAVNAAIRRSRTAGYTDDEIQLAALAAVGFLDESILNSRNPLFADWPRETLTQEFFKHHLAGEIFFDNLNRLLGMIESPSLADVLEVYLLCMLLGFRGRYGVSGRGELKALSDATTAKIRRIRGSTPEWLPGWSLPVEAPAGPARDPWTRRLLAGAIACTVLALVLFAAFQHSLTSGLSRFDDVVVQERGPQ